MGDRDGPLITLSERLTKNQRLLESFLEGTLTVSGQARIGDMGHHAGDIDNGPCHSTVNHVPGYHLEERVGGRSSCLSLPHPSPPPVLLYGPQSSHHLTWDI